MIYVTGASGYIGSALIQKLQCDGRLYSIIKRDTNNALMLQDGFSAVLNNNDNSVFVHLAARVHEGYNQNLDLYLKDNSNLVLDAWKLACSLNCKHFIFMSTIAVYDTNSLSTLTSDSCTCPPTAYGASKLRAEEILQSLNTSLDKRVDILRIPVVVGLNAKGNIGRLQSLIRSGIPLPFGSLQEKRSYIDIDTLCRYIACLISEKQFEPGNFIHLLSNENDETTPQLIKRLASQMHKNVFVFYIPFFVLKFLAATFDSLNRIFKTKLPFGRTELHKLNGKLSVKPGVKKLDQKI